MSYIGKTVKKGEVLGSGSFSKVYLTHPLEEGQDVNAYKVYSNDGDEAHRMCLIREREFLTRLADSKYIIDVLAWTDEGIVMPYYEQDLATYLTYRQEQMLEKIREEMGSDCSEQEIRNTFIRRNSADTTIEKLFRRIVYALFHMKLMDIVHCDLCPRNMFMNTEDDLVIGDFSSATMGTNKYCERTTHIQTLWWRAPEIIEGNKGYERYNSKIDMWSLGIIYVEMLFGVVPTSTWNGERIYNARDVYKKAEQLTTMITECKHLITEEQAARLTSLLQMDPCKRAHIYDFARRVLPGSQDTRLNKCDLGKVDLIIDERLPIVTFINRETGERLSKKVNYHLKPMALGDTYAMYYAYQIIEVLFMVTGAMNTSILIGLTLYLNFVKLETCDIEVDTLLGGINMKQEELEPIMINGERVTIRTYRQLCDAVMYISRNVSLYTQSIEQIPSGNNMFDAKFPSLGTHINIVD